MNRILASPKAVMRGVIPIAVMMIAVPAAAQLKAPDTQNNIPIKANRTAEVTPVCHKLREKKHSDTIHALCYSQTKQAVAVLVSGNADGITGQQIADVIVTEFGKSYVPAVGYWRLRERDKTAIIFLLNGITYGPYSGDDWQQGFKEVRGHTTEAWFKNQD